MISVIGYSEGSTTGLYAFAEEPEYYEQRVNLFIAMAPATEFLYSTDETLKTLSWFTSIFSVLKKYNYFEILGKQDPRLSMAEDLKENYPSICWTMSLLCEPSNITAATIAGNGSILTQY